jgi:hypothetical protein
MAAEIITLKVEGSPEDNGDVRLSELINELLALRSALKQTERVVSGQEESLIYYKVVDMSHSSPATIVLKAVPVNPKVGKRIALATVQKFFRTLDKIQKTGRAPKDIDSQTLEAYKALGAMTEKNISRVEIINTEYEVSIDESFKKKLDNIIGADDIIEGSIDGMLEWVNIHNTNRFHIYPSIGPKKVDCTFQYKIKDKVKAGIDRQVRVYGELKYRKRDDFPYAINVSDIEILPEDDELPTLYDLRGVAPNATGDMDSAEFVRSIRDAW